MSEDPSSPRPLQPISPYSILNENEFHDRWDGQMPLVYSRPPLNSIPDPSQCQSRTHRQQSQHNSKEKPKFSKPSSGNKRSDAIAEAELTSFLGTPKVYNVGRSAQSEPNSAQNTPQTRSGPRFSNVGATSSGCARVLTSVGGRGEGFFPRVSRGISIAVPEQLLVEAPHFELDEDRRFWENQNVQVLIRIRPLNNAEIVSHGYGRCLRQESSQTVVWLGHPETKFTFDHVAGESTSQENLFRVAGFPIVDNCMSGYNSCMFSYGQTGSGKTYTMMGETCNEDRKLGIDCGITSRIFEYLFSKITKEEEIRKDERLSYSCKCSFLEIYNEQITDLLEPLSTNLQLREDLKKGVYVENLTECRVRTVRDVLKLLQQGIAIRKISSTHMNSESSRSHSVFTCIIESCWEKDSIAHLRFARLNLVDLAGSERQKSSGVEGDRLKEASNINKSLSTLGKVIMSLVDFAHGKHRHVPYRDSRLTFLLQDSLGGNSKTTIIANVSPSTCSASETLSTLRFAQRAKLIKNNATINENASVNAVALQSQIQQLKGQLSSLMMNQHASVKLFEFAPTQSSLSYFPEKYETHEEMSVRGDDMSPTDGTRMLQYFEPTLRGALRRGKLAEMEIRKLKTEIEKMNQLIHQKEEEAKHAKTIISLRDEKIQFLESISDELISSDKFYQHEIVALRVEIQLLRENIDRNSKLTELELENFRLLEQVQLFQDFYERGERETLLIEISGLRNQILELLNVEQSGAHHQFPPTEKQELEVEKDLEQCMGMNTKMIREVDELRHQIGNRLKFNQYTCNSIEDVLTGNNIVDEATSSILQGSEVYCDKYDLQVRNFLNSNSDNINNQQLLDARFWSKNLKLEPYGKLNAIQTGKQQLIKMADNNDITTRELEDYCKEYNCSINLDSVSGGEGNCIAAFDAKLDKLYGELKEVHVQNNKSIKDGATLLSQDGPAESVCDKVESETNEAIICLQNKFDKLQSDFQACSCLLTQQNFRLKNSVSEKEEELKFACSEWERATLELTAFLIDGFRSLEDATSQIKHIYCSFPNMNNSVGEHAARAAKISVEKDKTILLLQKSLEDAQNTVMQMEQKLYSLKDATVLLIEYQQPEKSSIREETHLLISDDSGDVGKFTANKPILEDKNVENQAEAELLAFSVLHGYSKNSLRGTIDKVPFAVGCSVSETKLACLFPSDIENAINEVSCDALTFLSTLKCDIHNTVSMYKELVQDLLKDVGDMTKDIVELKKHQRKVHFSTSPISASSHLKGKNLLQMMQHIRNQLDKLSYQLSSTSVQLQDSTKGFPKVDGWIRNYSDFSTDINSKSSLSDQHRCANQWTEDSVDLKSDEGSDLSHDIEDLLFWKEFAKAYKSFLKLMDELMKVTVCKRNQSCFKVSALSDAHALENYDEKLRNAHDLHNHEKAQTSGRTEKQFDVEDNSGLAANFFSKIEEAYGTMKEADILLKAMIKVDKNANIMTEMWKQSGKVLMADKEGLSEEQKQLKSFIILKDGENQILQDQIQFRFTEIAKLLSLLGQFSIQMTTTVDKLLKTACSDTAKIVDKSSFCSSSSCLEDMWSCELKSNIGMLVFQCQVGEYIGSFRKMNKFSIPGESSFQIRSSIRGNFEIGHGSSDDNSAFQFGRFENEGDQIAYRLTAEVNELDLVQSKTTQSDSEFKRELEWKDILLKGLLFDFSLLQESVSHRKDITDEIEKLTVALSEVQHELQIKNAQLDEMLFQNAKFEGQRAEAEIALLNSNAELDQVKGALNVLSEHNGELTVLLKDLYKRNSETDKLLEEQKETIKILEKEIIHAASSTEKQQSLMKETEDALTSVTSERDQLLEKLCSLQRSLDISCALADEHQAISAKAHLESDTSKMYAKQKEEEVEILEHSVEELECTINVLEKKVHDMEEDIEKHRVIRDSLELEMQALRHRLSNVEDFTESLVSEHCNTEVHEDQLLRKFDVKPPEIDEAHSRIRFLAEKNAQQDMEIKQLRDHISELVLHAEAQASQYQQKYKNLEAMVHEVKTDLSLGYVAQTHESADKNSTKTRGSSSPFRCITTLVQQVNQEKDRELSNARLHIEELEALAASRHKEVCMLNSRLATAESMTHDVIRDLLGVKLDISNYVNIVDHHQLQNFIEASQHQGQAFAAMEQENVNLKTHLVGLLGERDRYMLEINTRKTDQLASQIILERLQQRDQILVVQNEMLKTDKNNLQKKVVELDEMVNTLFRMQENQCHGQRQSNSMLKRPIESDIDAKLAYSQRVISRISSGSSQYRRPQDRLGGEIKFR